MDNNEQKEIIHGYEIKRAIVFENNQGFALGENPNAPDPFVTWQFKEDQNGARDYFWGRYTSTLDTATRDYELRVAEFQGYGLSERDAYKYYLTQRPVDIGTFPKGPVRIVSFDSRESVERWNYQAWGYLVYDAPLTEKQISDYELKAAPDNPDVKTKMREQAQVVGEWEDKNVLLDCQRITERSLDSETFIARNYIKPETMMERYQRAKKDLSRIAIQKPIAEQLNEYGQQAARDNAERPAPKANEDNREDR